MTGSPHPADWRKVYLPEGLGAATRRVRPVERVTKARCTPEKGQAPITALERRALLHLVHEATGRPGEDWCADEFHALLNSAVHDLPQLGALEAECAALRGELKSLRQQERALLQARDYLQGELNRFARSPSFRIGRRLTLPARLVRGAWRQGGPMLLRPWHWPEALQRLRLALGLHGLRGTLQRLLGHQVGASNEVGLADYQDWYHHFMELREADRADIGREIEGWSTRPLISVLMPVFNTDPVLLEQTVESVRAQLYPNWELCIADDGSTRADTRAALERAMESDDRIRVIFREVNGHICKASNSALDLVNGELTALLDHDDLLTEDALYRVAAAVIGDPDRAVIYSDEDKIDGRGRLYDPYFKPDWNPDLLRSQNYFNHLTVYRTELVKRVGGFREGFEGSQDYDLLLRVVECVEDKAIHHIPRVLYHWRAVAGSEALEAGVKEYTRNAAHRALEQHLGRRGERGAVLPAPECPGQWRVRYPIPDPAPRVSIIVPTRNGLSLLTRALESVLHRTDYPDYEIIVVDNGSDDPAVCGYLDKLAELGQIRLIRDERPFNFSALNNRAAQAADSGVLVLLNNDVEVTDPDWLRELVSHAVRPGVGAVGARLWYPDDTLQHAGVVLGIGGVAGHLFNQLPRGTVRQMGRTHLIQNYSAVTAACLAVRRRLFDEVGGLDESDLAVAFNDIDFCLKLRDRGYRNVWTPYASLYHHESASRGYEDTPEKQARFAKEVGVMRSRWGQSLLDDPAYNPNLTLERTDCGLAWPPRERDAQT